jgi:hypothetical protein
MPSMILRFVRKRHTDVSKMANWTYNRAATRENAQGPKVRLGSFVSFVLRDEQVIG